MLFIQSRAIGQADSAGHHHADSIADVVHETEAARGQRGIRPAFGVSGVAVGTIASPGVAGRTLAEGYLTQPMVMASVSSPTARLAADLTLNFEGVTLDRGELNAGMYGEGYVDRRHPHTYLHELVATGLFGGGRSRFSVTMGKGFVPFGTDDPMSRPFVKYPVNHHLAQILERALISVAGASGPLGLEVAAFNGDEPESPSDMPNSGRLFDSWAARLTSRNSTGLEVQASAAHVVSPEFPLEGGLDHRKFSFSIRHETQRSYLLAEVARTFEGNASNHDAFTFPSLLAEMTLTRRRSSISFRAERSERPEEERLLNAFRTQRPHSDLSILGRTRWNVLSVAAATSVSGIRRGNIAPFAEVSMQQPSPAVRPTAFEPREFYGAKRLWSFSAGLRMGVGMKHGRMGRYGVAGDGRHAQGGHASGTSASLQPTAK